MNILKRIFGKIKPAKKQERGPVSTNIEINTIEHFSRLSVDNRIITIMKLGDKSPIDKSYFNIFQYAILTDPAINVKFAALKRIHLFKEHPELLPMMNKIKEENDYKDWEPYFSMALSRLGLISLNDLEKKINKF